MRRCFDVEVRGSTTPEDRFSHGPPPWAEVALSVYELHGTSALNALTRLADFGGAYHVAVEVYWAEWSFGATDTGSGVYPLNVGTSSLGNFLKRVPLGRTPYTPHGTLRILHELRAEWLGNGYSVLQRNCAHFSAEFADRLEVPPVPEWVNSLAGMGESLAMVLGAAGAEEAVTNCMPRMDSHSFLQDLAASDGEIGELEESAMAGDEEAQQKFVWLRYCEMTLEKSASYEQATRFHDIALDLGWSIRTERGETASAVAALLRDRGFRTAVAGATAAGLKLPVDQVDLTSLSAHAGHITRARLRVMSFDRRDTWPPALPPGASFEKGFKRALQKHMAGRSHAGLIESLCIEVVSDQARARPQLRPGSASASVTKSTQPVCRQAKRPQDTEISRTPSDTLSRLRRLQQRAEIVRSFARVEYA